MVKKRVMNGYMLLEQYFGGEIQSIHLADPFKQQALH
jgi:hypothetical protein